MASLASSCLPGQSSSALGHLAPSTLLFILLGLGGHFSAEALPLNSDHSSLLSPASATMAFFSSASGSNDHEHQSGHSSSDHEHHSAAHHHGPPPRHSQPNNISITLIKWFPLPSIRVSWSFDASESGCEAFRIIYHPINSRYRYIVEVPCQVFNVTLERLLPATEYMLTVNLFPMSVADQSQSRDRNREHAGATNTIRFISPQTEYNRFSKVRSTSLIIRKSPNEENNEIVVVKLGELFVVLFVLFGWFFIIFLFIRKWGKIRGIETTASLPVAPLPALATSGSTACSSAHPSFRGQRSKESAEEEEKMRNDEALHLFLMTEGELGAQRRTSCFTFEASVVSMGERRASDVRKYKSAENLSEF